MSDPELLVPASERQPAAGGWRLALLRLWCVLGVACAWFVLISGERALHFHEAIFTLAGFYAVWKLVAWITRPLSKD